MKIGALIDLGRDVNIIMLAYALKLGLQVRKTNIGASKIDKSPLKTFNMIIAKVLL